MNPLEVFARIGTTKSTSPRETISFDVWIVKIGLATFVGRGDKRRTNENKEKTNRKHVDTLWAGPLRSADNEFWPLRSYFEPSELC
jgi:hypothetical protein